MLSLLPKNLIFILALLLMSTAVYSEHKEDPFYRDPYYADRPVYKPTELVTADPLKDLDIDATVKQQLADFEKLIRDNVKKPDNLKFVEAMLPQLLKDYEQYLTKYYKAVKAIDPMVSIDDLPLIDKTLKEKFGWSTYDLMKEHKRLVETLTDEILPYIEAEIYEKEWNLTPKEGTDKTVNTTEGTNTATDKDKGTVDKTTTGSVEKNTGTNEHNDKYEYDYDQMLTYLNTSEEELLSFKTKWEEHQTAAAKAIDGYSNKTRSYVYSESGVWEEKQEDGSRVFIAGEKDKEIPGTKISDYTTEMGNNPTVEQGLGVAGLYTVNTVKNAFLVDDLHSVFLFEREIAIADYELQNIDIRIVSVRAFRDLLNAYHSNQARFKELMKTLNVENSKKWMEDSFSIMEGQTDGELDRQYKKSEVNKVTWKTFGKEVVGSSINILLAAAIKDFIFTALDQFNTTSWMVPGDDKNNTNEAENKWMSFGKRQLSTYTSLETYFGLLAFMGTAQGVNYAGAYLIKGWEKNWADMMAAKATKVKDLKFKFVEENAEKFASDAERIPITQSIKASKFATKLDGMLETEMYTSLKTGVGSVAKETFRLVKGFGFFSIGFALGDRFSRYITTSMTFSAELALPDTDPVKIKTKELIAEMTSSGGSWAGTANTAISLFLADVLVTKGAAIPKYYSAMRELNRTKCAVTYKNLKKIFEKNIANDLNKSKNMRKLSKWGNGLTKMTVLFGLQSYVDELVVSKLLFTGTTADYKEKMKTLSEDLQKIEIISLLRQMVLTGDISDVEKWTYADYENYVFLGDLISSFKQRSADVSCCLAFTKQEELESKETTSGEELSFKCLLDLLGNINDPTKNKFVCSSADIKAKNVIDQIKDTTPEQDSLIKKATPKLIELFKNEEEKDNIVGLVEKAKFADAEQMISSGNYDADVVTALTTAIDQVSSGYDGMTVESGLKMLKTLFIQTYPAIIGTGTFTNFGLKKEVLNALTTVIYEKLKVVGSLYSYKTEDGLVLVGEDYLQFKIYNLMMTVMMQTETMPGYKSSVYGIVARLGFKGVTIDDAGVTKIKIPENLEKKHEKKKLPYQPDQNDTDDINLIIPDNGGSGGPLIIKTDTNKTEDINKNTNNPVLPDKK